MAPTWPRFFAGNSLYNAIRVKTGQIYSNDCSDCDRPRNPPAREKDMAIATLVTWLITVSIGAYMLRAWIARGGGRARRGAGGGGVLPPVLVYGHAGLAVT